MPGRYDAARLPRTHPAGSGDQQTERTIMGNVAVAEELAGSDELDELYRLDASETDPEDDGEDGEDDDSEDDGDGEGVGPEEMPHE